MSLNKMGGDSEGAEVVDLCNVRSKRRIDSLKRKTDVNDMGRFHAEQIVENARILSLFLGHEFVFDKESPKQNVLYCEDAFVIVGVDQDVDFQRQYEKVRNNFIEIDERVEGMIAVGGSVTLYPNLCFLRSPSGQMFEFYFALDSEGRISSYHCWRASRV